MQTTKVVSNGERFHITVKLCMPDANRKKHRSVDAPAQSGRHQGFSLPKYKLNDIRPDIQSNLRQRRLQRIIDGLGLIRLFF